MRKQRSIPRAYAPLLQALRRVTLAGIVTTNYDLVFEKILGPTDSGRLGGFNYGSPGGQLRGTHAISSRYSYKAPPITGTIPLLKLHGSLNWGLGPDGKLETYVDCRPSRGLRYTPVLLPPGRSAEGIALQQVWKSAKDTLTAASTWIVCGYSVPDYDSDVRDLLEASAKELRRVVVLDPEANSVAAKVRNLLRGRASRIDYICGGALVPEVSPRELRALILGGEWTEAPAW